MDRIRNLNRFQKGLLIFMTAAALVFAAAYAVTIRRVGFAYKDAILVPVHEDGCTVYAGKVLGQPSQFTVSEDGVVVFRHGDRTYGPYTSREDPEAIPEDAELAAYMTGMELLRGEDVLFLGGVLEAGDSCWLYNADGTLHGLGLTYVTSDGIERDESGRAVDPAEPSVSTLLALMHEPRLTHRGEWPVWLGGVFICALNAFSMLFADELFCWSLALRIRHADRAEPTDWEIAGRYVSWIMLSVLALILFVAGLQ